MGQHEPMNLICIICNGPYKYKCPVCREPYCSLNCYKKHKENPCTPPQPDVTLDKEEGVHRNQEREYDFPTQDTVSVERLKLLENSQELKLCLENPHVRTILEALDKSDHPDEMMQEYMQEPIFTEFVDACLKVVEPQDQINNT